MLKPYFVVLFTVDNAFYHNLSRFHYKLKARMGAVSAYSTVNEVSMNDAKKSAYVCRLSTAKKNLFCAEYRLGQMPFFYCSVTSFLHSSAIMLFFCIKNINNIYIHI